MIHASGNPLNDRDLFPEPLYNLVYLEIAACRLSVLPANMSQMVPNLRVLNVNYNFLSDVVKPLVGLSRLRKLTVVGSRLKASKPLVRMLQKMPEAELLDFRYVQIFIVLFLRRSDVIGWNMSRGGASELAVTGRPALDGALVRRRRLFA